MFVHVCGISLLLLSRLCVIGSEPAEPLVGTVSAAPLNSQVDKVGARLSSSAFGAFSLHGKLWMPHTDSMAIINVIRSVHGDSCPSCVY